MRGLLTLTHILFPIFLGLIIGGLIWNRAMVGVGVVLLILDVIIGIGIQRIVDSGNGN